MDNLTHSLTGALIGQAGLKRKTGLGMAALIIGANLPDVDASCFFWLDGVEQLAFRRGITHGPIAWVLLPLLLAGALWWFDRWQDRRGKRPNSRLPVNFKWLYLLGLIGCLSHPALDWMNVYGIRLLEPFSSQWFYGDILFIIDIWLWLGMGFALWFALRREKRGKSARWPAGTALLLAAAYIGWNGMVSQSPKITWSINTKGPVDRRSVPDAVQIALPQPLFSWERDLIVGEHNNWFSVPAGAVPSSGNARPIADMRCAWPDVESLRQTNSQLDSFLFWSRAPYAERAEGGGHVVIGDARYQGRGTFRVELPEVPCEPADQD